MEKALCNNNGKIWVFWNRNMDCQMQEKDEQQLTYEIQYTQIPDKFFATYVYAKCRDHLRIPLWERILHLSDRFKDHPWCVVGDFNVITSIEEKMEGIPYNMKKIMESIAVIEGCRLVDLCFTGPKFAWTNNRGGYV